jgi:phosphatidylserine/phosphatidylglycerophosphate/cardiolipin synthase-like enzyme
MGVIDKVTEELLEAEEFIRIAIFQLHNKQIFDVLNEKLREGVSVKIFTLPEDSINADVREEVSERFNELQDNGAEVFSCKWNVGDPGRTTTAVGRWYSFHGKFIVTDKSAISLSANFTNSPELDALLIFKDEEDKIEEFKNKFDELLDLFINENSGYNGTIREKITDCELPDISSVFELPDVIETETHINHWILHYPTVICPDYTLIEDKLYILPFDTKGRNLIMSILEEASDYIYISTESFTDPDFTKFLKKLSLKNIDIRIISGATSMDFTDRVQSQFRELLAHGVKIKTTVEDLHAKIIITDKHLVVSSINLNKMNLGFKTSKNFWRENTETATVCTDNEIINNAKAQYMNVFENSIYIETKLAEKLEKVVGSVFTSTFGLKSRQEVKELFARLIVRKEIEVKKFILDVGKLTSLIMGAFGKSMVEKDHFIMALILYYLSERKLDIDQIKEKLDVLETDINLNRLLARLERFKFIKKQEDFYKLNVERLFDH